VQERLNRSICRLDCGLGWADGSRSSIVFARWLQCALNTIEPSMCGGDAACCQIPLTTCFFTVTTRLRCDCYMLYRKLSFRVFLLSLSTCKWDHCYSLKLEEMGSTVQCWVLSSVGIAVLYKYQTLNMDKLTNNFADDEHYKSGACKKRGELSCRRCC